MGLTTPQYACLELLAREPGASNSALARGAFVTRQTMNTLLRGLIDRGLVHRAPQAPSGRALPTELTRDGWQVLRDGQRAVNDIEELMIEGLTEVDQQALHAALNHCITQLGREE